MDVKAAPQTTQPSSGSATGSGRFREKMWTLSGQTVVS